MTVVVDYAATGAGVAVRCAPGTPVTGLDALAQAGFAVDLVNGMPFVCHIDGQPAQQTCDQFPPANAYWGYWHASRGGSWAYSASGAGSSHPAQGSVEGWAFETNGQEVPPSVAPPAAAPATTPRPTAAPTARATVAATGRPTPVPVTTAVPAASAGASSGTAAPPATPPAAASPSGATVSEGPAAAGSATGTGVGSPSPIGSSAPTAAAAVPAGTASGDPSASGAGGPPVGTAAGIALVVALIAVGGILARRRGPTGA